MSRAHGDILLMLGATALVAWLYQGGHQFLNSMLGAQLMLPLFLTIAWHHGTYSLRSLTNWKASSVDMGLAVLISSALLNFLAFCAKMNDNFSRVVFVSGMTLAVVGMTLSRYLVVKWVRQHWGPSQLNRLIIDAGGRRCTSHMPIASMPSPIS